MINAFFNSECINDWRHGKRQNELLWHERPQVCRLRDHRVRWVQGHNHNRRSACASTRELRMGIRRSWRPPVLNTKSKHVNISIEKKLIAVKDVRIFDISNWSYQSFMNYSYSKSNFKSF